MSYGTLNFLKTFLLNILNYSNNKLLWFKNNYYKLSKLDFIWSIKTTYLICLVGNIDE